MSWLLAIYTWLPAVMSCAFLRTSTILLKRLIRCSMRLKKSKTMLRLGEEYSGVYPYVTARYNYRTPKTKTPIQPRRESRCPTRCARPARLGVAQRRRALNFCGRSASRMRASVKFFLGLKARRIALVWSCSRDQGCDQVLLP